MPPKKVCSDKAPLNQREWSVSECYARGRRAGFVAGIQRGTRQTTQQGIQRAKIVRAIPQAALQLRTRAGVRRARETVARRTEQAAQQRENTLMANQDVNIEPPRVKPAGRRQKFRNYYGLNRVAEVVAQNVVEAPPIAPVNRINIKEYIDRRGGRGGGNGNKNRSDLLAELVQSANIPGVPFGMSTIKKMGKGRMIELLLATGNYVRGGER
jgi:hypothetical protein